MPDHESGESPSNVVSLDSRRKGRKSVLADVAASPPESGPSERTAAPSAPDAGADIASRAVHAPRPGRLFWLHCPVCETIEYTELDVPGGRQHKCGALVEEAIVEIDLRAEATLAEINLQRIGALESYLEQQKQRYQEYLRRLALIAGKPPEPYPLTEEQVKALPVAEVDALGLLVSDALHNAAKRFEKKD